MFFDTHAHYDNDDFDKDRYQLLDSLEAGGVSLVLNPGCDRRTSEQAIELAEKYDFIYAAVGWHPHDAKSFDGGSTELIRGWARHPKVKAIGEIGLDYYRNLSERDVQRAVFARQMELARQLNLPVIIHDRDAHAECMDIIGGYPAVTGVFHCYSGSAEMAKRVLDMGWYLSFTGAITFKNARKAIETIKLAPLERIMIETDCPYLAPEPHRGKRNDSRNLVYIAQVIADIKGLPADEVAACTMENGKRFFAIG